MSIEVFFSYSHKDEDLRDELAKQLSILKRQGVITTWHDREISAGTEWAGAIDAHMNSAQVILLLISADFLASDYCWDIEVKRAMERHQAGEARVIPVILRPVDYWQEAPFGKLQAFPINAKPVTTWDNRDAAFVDVAQAIRKVVKELPNTSPEPTSPSVSSPVKPQASTSLTSGERRRLESKRDELQEHYDLLSEEIQELRSAERTDDLTPRERFRLKKQIQEAETERDRCTEQLEEIESKIEKG